MSLETLAIPARLEQHPALVAALGRLQTRAIAAKIAREDHRLDQAVRWVKQGRVGLAFHEMARL